MSIPAELKLNPFPMYAEMRRNCPVAFQPDQGVWMVYRYDDVKAGVQDHVNFSSKFDVFMPPERTITGTVVTSDPPQHTKLRNLVNKAFSPKAVADLEGYVHRLTHECIDAVVESGKMDLVRDLCEPVPLLVMAELLGIPGDMRARFKIWSDHVIEGYESIVTGDMSPQAGPEASFREMRAYFADLSRQRAAKPSNDLISSLSLAEVDGERLTEKEVAEFCILLLVAGNETSRNLVGNAVRSFLEFPDQLELLRANPSLLPSAVEESLRFRSPGQLQNRVALRDIEIGGQQIKKGQLVIFVTGSANRDETRFPDPDRFDITRKPNQHLAFGHGIHFCLGAPLARLETRIMLGAIVERLHDLRRDESLPLVPAPTLAVFGLRSLPILFRPGTRRGN